MPGEVEFKDAAEKINAARARGVSIAGAIVQKDDGVLINNRLQQPVPIVDEVMYIDRVPVGMPAAVEVAHPGRTIEKLCNPYDIATLVPSGFGRYQACRTDCARADGNSQRGRH